MKQSELEPGLLNAFRLLILYWVGSLMVERAIDVLRGWGSWFTNEQLLLLLAWKMLTLAYLSWQPAQRQLGRFFMPVALVMSVTPLFVEKYWQLKVGSYVGASVADSIYLFSLREDLILPLLIVAWQYRFRHVVLYTVVISLVEWQLISQFEGLVRFNVGLWPEDYIGRAIIYLLVGYVITWLMARQRQQQQELAAAHAQQGQANKKLAHYAATVEQLSISRERNRLARELHDTLAHSLSAVMVQLGAISQLWDLNPAKAKVFLAQADETTRSGLVEARRSLQALRAAPLEEVGLISALSEIAELAAERANFTLDWQVPEVGQAPPLPPHVEQAIYRIAQEALENIVRHARAKNVTIQFTENEETVKLLIQDDGIGFDMDDLHTKERRWGVHGMSERAQMLGGTLTITSQPEQGTSISLIIPIQNEQM